MASCYGATTPLELANVINDGAVTLGLNDVHCTMAAEIASDLETYPYIGETEDDKYKFSHAGLNCTVRRTPLMFWCGYVESSLLAELDLDEGADVDVHGGLSYGIGNWVGFDCNHLGDLTPREFLNRAKIFEGIGQSVDGVYRDYAFVVFETKRLAEQIAALQ